MREKRFFGAYIRKNLTFLKEKASKKHDPRHSFYGAMLSSETYEEYYKKVGELKVYPPTFKNGPISAHMEIRYARWKGWIADRSDAHGSVKKRNLAIFKGQFRIGSRFFDPLPPKELVE